MHIESSPDGRATAPHYDPTASNTQPQHPFFVETKMALPGSICSVQSIETSFANTALEVH